jgi:hypothetical protein
MRKSSAVILSAAFAAWTMPATAQLFVTNGAGNSVGEYDATTGAAINEALITGLNDPLSIAIYGSDLFIVNGTTGVIGEYDATTGAPINPSLITDPYHPFGIAVSDGNIFVTQFGDEQTGAGVYSIGEYSTSGGAVNPLLITGLGPNPYGIAVSGSDLFVTAYEGGSNIPGGVGEYTTSGATVNASLITGLNSPTGLALSNGNLFVAYDPHGYAVGEFTTSGATVNPILVTSNSIHLGQLGGIAVDGTNLYVSTPGTNTLSLPPTLLTPGTVGEYTTSGGTINSSLVSIALANDPRGIAVMPNVNSGSNQTVDVGGGPTAVGGVEGAFPAVTNAGTFASTYNTETAQGALQTALGSAAAGAINFGLAGTDSNGVVLPNSAVQFWDLHFTGTFTGDATVTLHFDPTLIGGANPSSLVIWHYTNGGWNPVANETVDPIADTITFTTSSFSPFILGVPEPSSIVLAGAGLVRLSIFARRRSRGADV